MRPPKTTDRRQTADKGVGLQRIREGRRQRTANGLTVNWKDVGIANERSRSGASAG